MNIQEKAQNYAVAFFFSFVPDEWSNEDLLNFLRKQEGDFEEMTSDLNVEEELCVWEPFENYNPSWVADQINIMTMQLTDLFNERNENE